MGHGWKRRTAQNLTLVQAGKRCGYSASTMSRLETGRQPLSDVTLLRHFAEVFSIPLGLFGLAPARTESSPIGTASTSSAGLGATVSGKTAREGGEDPVRRRRALTGLAGLTGATLLGIPDHAGARDDSVLVPSAPVGLVPAELGDADQLWQGGGQVGVAAALKQRARGGEGGAQFPHEEVHCGRGRGSGRRWRAG